MGGQDNNFNLYSDNIKTSLVQIIKHILQSNIG